MMEPIEKKSIFIKPSLQHRMQSSHQPEKKKQKISIKWDEVTIAEHDKERGSRQKIDEAPTPFRYGSESDQSEAESGSSDGEHLTRRRKVSAGSFDQANPDPDTVTNTANNSQAASHLAHKYAQHSVLYQWEAVHAKLTYEKHLQEQQQLQQQQLSSQTSQIPTEAITVLSVTYNKIKDIIELIGQLHQATRKPVDPLPILPGSDMTPFLTQQKYKAGLLLANLNWQSPIFRFAIR
eukprot:gene36070-46154_t